MHDFEGHSESTELPLFDRHHFLLVIRSNNISVQHHLQDSATFTVYVTACDLETQFTRYNRLSSRFDNRGLTTVLNEQPVFIQPVVKPRCTTGLTTGCTPYSRLSNWLSNGFDNRLNVCIHDTTGCQTGLTTGLITGCIV